MVKEWQYVRLIICPDSMSHGLHFACPLCLIEEKKWATWRTSTRTKSLVPVLNMIVEEVEDCGSISYSAC